MQFPLFALLLASAFPAWSQSPVLPELLSRKAFDKFHSHARALYFADQKIEADLQLSIHEERLLLHLPKRGFPYLALLTRHQSMTNWAGALWFAPANAPKSLSREEAITQELLSRAIIARLAANNYACFQLLKDVAPTDEAMKVEAQAKELIAKIDNMPEPTQAGYLEKFESIRALFDELKPLPKLTTAQLADERAEIAVLSPREYGNEKWVSLPQSTQKWVERESKWHQEWDHKGYLLAYSQLTGPKDYEQFKIVVNLKGGIFEWNRFYSGSHNHPDSYESKLQEAEFQDLKKFLKKLPPSDAIGEATHFMLSVLEDGHWRTRTYNSLPIGSPFEDLLKRMIRQSKDEMIPFGSPSNGFLKTYSAMD